MARPKSSIESSEFAGVDGSKCYKVYVSLSEETTARVCVCVTNDLERAEIIKMTLDMGINLGYGACEEDNSK